MTRISQRGHLIRINKLIVCFKEFNSIEFLKVDGDSSSLGVRLILDFETYENMINIDGLSGTEVLIMTEAIKTTLEVYFTSVLRGFFGTRKYQLFDFNEFLNDFYSTKLNCGSDKNKILEYYHLEEMAEAFETPTLFSNLKESETIN